MFEILNKEYFLNHVLVKYGPGSKKISWNVSFYLVQFSSFLFYSVSLMLMLILLYKIDFMTC